MVKLNNEQELTVGLEKLNSLCKRIELATQAGREAQNTNSYALFKARFSDLSDIFENLQKLGDDLLDICVKLENDDDKKLVVEILSQAEALYYEAKALYMTFDPPAKAETTNKPCTSNIQLPKINLPTFSGNDLKEWPHFKDLFRSLIIDNQSLSDIERFQYLNSCLLEPALGIVSTLPLTSDNFAAAWSALERRYENIRLLASHYLDEVLGVKPLSDKSNLSCLQAFTNSLRENVSAFRRLQLHEDADFILLHLSLRLLSPHLRDLFETQYASVKVPTFAQFVDFLEKRCHVGEVSSTKGNQESPKPSTSKYLKPKNVLLATNNVAKSCPHCKEAHLLYICPKFVEVSPSKRWQIAKSCGVCYNCLASSHRASDCNSASRCKYCKGIHNSLLHWKVEAVQHNFETDHEPSHRQPSGTEARSVLASYLESGTKQVLLGTAIVRIKDAQNKPHKIRIVIDSGSQCSLISKDCVNKLGLKKQNSLITIASLGQMAVPNANEQVNCCITPRFTTDKMLHTDAIIVDNICNDLPSHTLPQSVFHKFASLKLADPKFWKPGKIDFLLGSDLYMEILPDKPRPPIRGCPGAMDTALGWVILGEVFSTSLHNTSPNVSLFVSAQSTEQIVQNFWEIEEPHMPSKIVNPDDDDCEQQFIDNYSRDSSGRYIVPLPFKVKPPEFENSDTLARNRYKRLETKLAKQPDFREDYHNFLQEYLDLGHMSVTNNESAYMIPHHAVIKADSSTTKLRVVFDASAKCLNGSLNEFLHIGPKLQLDIADILLNFRLHKVAFTADICKMYRQILVRSDDRKYQHIWWRPNSNADIQKFELNTVTYGTTCAPYLSLRVLKQLQIDEGSDFPLAAAVLNDSIYVDDVVTGSDSITNALELQKQLVNILAKGGFELRKWMSNTPELLQAIPDKFHEQPVSFSPSDDPVIKVLGLQWDPISDCFSYAIKDCRVAPTKRMVLSTVARIFDPLGLLSPVVFLAKYIMQQTWHAAVNWDDILPPNLLESWNKFVDQLQYLRKIKVPRFVESHCSDISLLGFCDASERGFGAVIYLRVVDTLQNVKLYLLKGKSRLAPLKSISLPRLELCGALLLTQVYKSVQPFLTKVACHRRYFWTDSTIVLAWLRTSPHLLKTFVANRVTQILEETQIEQWSHVPSSLNPADCSSRGMYPNLLENHDLWWYGPEWAYLSCDNWPSDEPPDFEDLPEVKKDVVVLIAPPVPPMIEFLKRYSSLGKLQNILGYVLRFCSNARLPKQERKNGNLYVSERKEALKLCVKSSQAYYFHEELVALKNGFESKSLLKLHPFVDPHGIIRVGGRLRNSSLAYDEKFPMILHQKCHLTLLLIDHYHKVYGHAGPQLLLSLLRRSFWIVNGRRIVRQRILNCNRCYRLKAAPSQNLMGDLPLSRCRQGRPFVKVGIDYAGPFFIKEGIRKNTRITKAYLCVFVCMAVKAVHLEVVSDLTTDAFLSTLDRFIARRGLPLEIFSDCGTNFVGASRQLRELYAALRQQSLQEAIENHLAEREIVWRFNPPSAPHFGGLWEAAVKSAKYHLIRIAGERHFTFEELTTLFANIEAIMNSRPLCPLSSAPDEFDTLTPGHFLTGAPLLARPVSDLTEIKENRLSRWQLILQSTQHFWKRWHLEYLTALNQRSKWNKKSNNVEKGDLVLLHDVNTSPLLWKVARIIDAHPGTDGCTRVVTLRTPNGVLKRPITKIVRLLNEN